MFSRWCDRDFEGKSLINNLQTLKLSGDTFFQHTVAGQLSEDITQNETDI